MSITNSVLGALFGATESSVATRFCEVDHLFMAQAFVGKGGLYQAFRFDCPQGTFSDRLSIGFTIESETAFNRYLRLYDSYIASHHPNDELLLKVRLMTFAATWGSFNPSLLQALPKQTPFGPGELNLLVLPAAWRLHLDEMEKKLHLPPGMLVQVKDGSHVLVTAH